MNDNRTCDEKRRRTPPPALLVTVDTEEEGLWSDQFRPTGNTVDNIEGVGWFQSLCDQYCIRPTYLVDTPVVCDDRAVERLRAIAESNRAEIGAHLHPWCGPPLDGPTDSYRSYLCNLPANVQRAKLVRLTEAIEKRFGQAPTSFRAGRYGLDAAGARILIELGYVVDSSVIPLTDYSPQGGPNFYDAPVAPYFPAKHDLRVPAASGRLLEVPVSVGFNRGNQAWARKAYAWIGRPPARWLRLRGLCDRLGLLQRIKCSPEQADGPRMNRLVSALLSCGVPCVVMMLHSSSLVWGLSPYARDRDAWRRLRDALSETFAYCIEQQRMGSMTLTEFAERWTGAHQGRHEVEATT